MKLRTIWTAGLSLIIASCVPAPALADSWRGPDKRMHLAAGYVLATAGTAATGDPWKGFLVGASAGVAKELYDATGRGNASWKDAAVTIAGAAAGAYLGGLFVARWDSQTVLFYAREF